MNVAFIGLGNMGGPMACNVACSDFDLSVFDLDDNKIDVVYSTGAGAGRNVTRAASVAEAVRGADFIMTSLPSPKVIDAIAFGADGILENVPEGAVWIELSTNNLDIGRRIFKAGKEKGIAVLDAPVTGGVEGAAAGSLMVLTGGDEDAFAKSKPLLDVIGGEIVHLGKNGAGYVAKISQVVLCYLNSVALSEALMLGVKGGVNADKMLKIIQGSTGASYVADRYGPAILNGSYDPGFVLGLAHKDMALTLELGEAVEATLPMCTQVENIYKLAVAEYGFDANHLMAVKLLEEENGVCLRSTI
ncbi:MAG: NAD(P)-dependent oxidoreductase [Rhodobacteraceae bacterium]|nr:NAD(P)-dependent oxidoreductase [Paracoccaceae bacterium]